MYHFFITISIFLLIVLCHVIIHRTLALLHIWTAKTIVVYLLGLVFPIDILLYALIVTGYLLFFLSYLYEAESPSAKILTILKKKRKLTSSQIFKYFSTEELFERRLALLVEQRYVFNKNGRFYISPKGKIITKFFDFYRKLIRWDKGG